MNKKFPNTDVFHWEMLQRIYKDVVPVLYKVFKERKYE